MHCNTAGLLSACSPDVRMGICFSLLDQENQREKRWRAVLVVLVYGSKVSISKSPANQRRVSELQTANRPWPCAHSGDHQNGKQKQAESSKKGAGANGLCPVRRTGTASLRRLLIQYAVLGVLPPLPPPLFLLLNRSAWAKTSDCHGERPPSYPLRSH